MYQIGWFSINVKINVFCFDSWFVYLSLYDKGSTSPFLSHNDQKDNIWFVVQTYYNMIPRTSHIFKGK